MSKALKIFLIVFIILLILSLGLFFYFYRSLKPVLGPPVADVSTLLPKSTNQPKPATEPDKTPEYMTKEPFTILGDFEITIFADDLNKPRVLKFDDNGNLLVSAMAEGRVYAIKPDREKKVLVSELLNPHGLEIKDGYLYIAETDKVARYKYDAINLSLGEKENLFDLPGLGGHYTRTIKFGSDDNLYVVVGSSCNVCNESDERRSALLKYNPADWTYEIFAKGLRNTVFFIENPKTRNFWSMDMGRDLIGDDLPPEEFNIILEGKDYGWPTCYGDKIHDTSFDKKIYERDPCEDTESPIYELPAHFAPLGLVFIDSPIFPESWQGDVLVALHGSWNRSAPGGYKVVHLGVEETQIIADQDFLTGFLKDGGAIGRPVDLVFGPDNALYLSDDKAGVIYKINK